MAAPSFISCGCLRCDIPPDLSLPVGAVFGDPGPVGFGERALESGGFKICLIAYVVPRTAVLGAILLTGYLGSATATQVRVQDFWFVLPAAIAGLVWGALWLRDPGLHEMLFPGRLRLAAVQ